MKGRKLGLPHLKKVNASQELSLLQATKANKTVRNLDVYRSVDVGETHRATATFEKG